MEQNKNKIIFLAFGLLLILSLVFTFSGCVPPVPEVIEVTGVNITEEDQSMKVDETLQLTAIITPEDATNKAITWESDNPDVAAVDENGLVTALKRGIANITVTTEDGTFTDTIKITVTKSTPAPSPTPTPTPDKYTLTTTVLPADSGTVTGDGEYEQGDEVSVTATNANGYEFDRWSSTTGTFADATSIDTTFTMPAEEVTVTANFTQVYEATFGVILIPEELPAGLTSRGEDPVPNLAGVEIEIFSDEARTDKVTTVTTDENGMATIKLPNGTYYFIATGERYICAPIDEIIDENYEVITLPTPIATLTVQGSFTISDEDISDTILIIARDAYIVTFLATENNIKPSGVSRGIVSPPLEDVTIEIYEGRFRNTAIPERTAKEPVDEFKIATLTTDSNGIAQVYLPNGPYDFTASKEGYAYSPPENTDFSVQRAVQKGYFEVIGADIIDDPIQVPMERVYSVTIADVAGGTASVAADPDVVQGETVTVTISDIESGKTFSSIAVTGDDNSNSITTIEVTAGEEYSFIMPAEDVTVTVTLVNAYILTLTAKPAEVGTTTGDGEYKEGDEVVISANPAVGYEFVNWTDDDDGNAFISTDNPYTFNMPEDEANYIANFATPAGCFGFDIGSKMILFYNCSEQDVIIPSMIYGAPVEKIAFFTFMSKGLTSVTIPDSVTSIGQQAFFDNSLESVIIPDSVTQIDPYAFAVNNLTSITLSNSLSMISSNVFHMNNLTSVTIPDSVTSIGYYAFYGNNLISITIGSNVDIDLDLYTMGTYIGFQAVYNSGGQAARTYNYDGSQWVKQQMFLIDE